MADGNTFPTLDADSIVDTLAEYQIHIKLSQLRQPTSDFAFSIYSQIVQKVTGLTHASLNQPVDEACDSLNTSYHVCTWLALIHRYLLTPYTRISTDSLSRVKL
jgi:hypothetical protein